MNIITYQSKHEIKNNVDMYNSTSISHAAAMQKFAT